MIKSKSTSLDVEMLSTLILSMDLMVYMHSLIANELDA